MKDCVCSGTSLQLVTMYDARVGAHSLLGILTLFVLQCLLTGFLHHQSLLGMVVLLVQRSSFIGWQGN